MRLARSKSTQYVSSIVSAIPIDLFHDEFDNGRDYYAIDGQPLKVLPGSEQERPAREFLEWHQGHSLG